MVEGNFVHNYLYLHPGENPTVVFVSPIEFILDNVRPPEKDKPKHAAWNSGNNMVVSWIVHSVSTSIKQNIIWMNKASEIWNDLKKRFSQGIFSRISSLQLDIATLHQGLNDQFTNATSHVLLLDLISDITKDTGTATTCTSSTACSYCGKYEHNEVVFYRKNGFPNQDKGFKSASNDRKHCTHCNKSGHTVEHFKGHNLNDASTSAQTHHIGSASANQPSLANLPTIFWCFAAGHVTLLNNCMPAPLLDDATPYEKL
ncbi:hypothetical protein V8G54_004474 [Vigna mungo]|uniref:Retrotransposon Copia-like N-terminal domain-containing protein n=1 Tax=Vigna mungo TaxID=3915 RepID=A0AAQ3PEB6_VIGMU